MSITGFSGVQKCGYVGDIAGFSNNITTTTYGISAM
jgi:hypothetical protein